MVTSAVNSWLANTSRSMHIFGAAEGRKEGRHG